MRPGTVLGSRLRQSLTFCCVWEGLRCLLLVESSSLRGPWLVRWGQYGQLRAWNQRASCPRGLPLAEVRFTPVMPLCDPVKQHRCLFLDILWVWVLKSGRIDSETFLMALLRRQYQWGGIFCLDLQGLEVLEGLLNRAVRYTSLIGFSEKTKDIHPKWPEVKAVIRFESCLWFCQTWGVACKVRRVMTFSRWIQNALSLVGNNL